VCAARDSIETASPLHIVVLEPDEATRLALKELAHDYEARVHSVGDPQALLASLQKHRPQLVLLSLPANAEAAGERLAAVRAYDRDVSTVVIADAPAVDTAVIAMKYRALEYLTTPLDTASLRRAIDTAIEEQGLSVTLEQRLNREIGARVRERRGSLGLPLRQVANRTGLSISLLSQIELGKSAASIASLYKLSRALRTPLSQLLDEI